MKNLTIDEKIERGITVGLEDLLEAEGLLEKLADRLDKLHSKFKDAAMIRELEEEIQTIYYKIRDLKNMRICEKCNGFGSIQVGDTYIEDDVEMCDTEVCGKCFGTGAGIEECQEMILIYKKKIRELRKEQDALRKFE